MDFKKELDYITTFGLAMVPVAVVILMAVMNYISAEWILVVTIIVALLGKYTSDARVKDAVETVKKWKWVYYLLSAVGVIAPVLLTYQYDIMGQAPAYLVTPFSVMFALLLTYTSGKRVENAETDSVDITDDQPAV